MQQKTLEGVFKGETQNFSSKTGTHRTLEKESYDPLRISQEYDLGYIGQGEEKERKQVVMGHCPCPKISAPVYAAGFVVFSPL
jgi:hypothetical protein